MEAHLVDLVRFDVTEAQIGEVRDRCAKLDITRPGGYEEVRAEIAHLRTARTAVEKRRKELKASSLEFGRKVDAAAHRLTGLLEAIETPLLTAKKAADDAEEAAKREKERADLIALEAKLAAEREEAEAKAKAEREAEEARLAAERERLAAERAQQEEANRVAVEAQRVEREKLDAEKAELRKQQAAVEAQAREADRIDRDRRQREQAEQDRLAAEEAARIEAARIEAMKPDIEKVHGFASAVRNVCNTAPAFDDNHPCAKAINWAIARLCSTAEGLEAFKGKTGP